MPEAIQSDLKLKSFYAITQSGLRDTDPPIVCKLCGQVKKEFLTPAGFRFWNNGYYTPGPKVIVLDCECERRLKMYKEFYANYRQCETKDKTKYSDLIDGRDRPQTDNENEILRIGVITRDQIREREIKCGR